MEAWKDTTSYSRGDTKREPRTWEWRPAHVSDIRIVVTKHVHHGEEWLMLCEAVGITKHHPLNTTDAEEAKRRAVDIFRLEAAALRARLAVALERLNNL